MATKQVYMLSIMPVRTQIQSVTPRDITSCLDISLLTVSGWRKGSRVREPLPCVRTKFGDAVRVTFFVPDLEDWLDKYRPDLSGKWRECRHGG